MAKPKPCKQCGVPKLVYKGLIWHGNGTINEAKDPDHRMLFCESDNLEALFAGIEKIIGMSIEKLVIESKRRVTKEYLEKMIPATVRKLIYTFRPTLIAEKMAVIGKAHGYGNIEMVTIKKRTEKGDYLLMTIEHPYSVRFFRGDNLGGMEAASGRECTVKEEKVGEDKYQLEMWVSAHPPELQERLKLNTYPLKPGDIHLDRCPSCGVPLAVAAHRWDIDTGVITNPGNGIRMALFGPAGLEAVFNELEGELGETIPETIIEAQRLYTRENFLVGEWLVGEEGLRNMIAMRGLGVLTGFSVDENSLNMVIENPSIVHILVGIVKGLFEMARGVDSTIHAWSISEDGDLSITISINA
jgi:hypothetical protein